MFILDTMLKRLVKKGALTVIDPDGRVHTYGNGQGFTSTLRIADTATSWKLPTCRRLLQVEAMPTDGVLSLVPFLVVRDAAEAIAFYAMQTKKRISPSGDGVGR